MSAYSTQEISKEEAVEFLLKIQSKAYRRLYSSQDEKELEDILNEYVYSEKHNDVLEVLINYRVKEVA